MRVLSNLLNALAAALDEGRYVHVGSAILWQRHWEHLTKMRRTLALFEYSQVNTNPHKKEKKYSAFCTMSHHCAHSFYCAVG